jgi:Tfp pilus assembly protein PilV
MKRHWVRRAGLSLTEVILAMMVFIIASGGMIAAHLYSDRMSEHATNTMRAVDDLEDIMERLHATPFDTIQASFPNGVANGGGVNNYAVLVGGYTLEGEQIVVTYPSQTTGRLEVRVTVNWTERSRNFNTSLSTVRTEG